eukprot:693598-Amphidinium_carterae.2
MANIDQPAQQLQQQHQRVQQVEAENARLRTDGIGALPHLVQVLSAQTRDRLPSLVDTKGIGKPASFSGKEDKWREWSVKFESFVVGVYGEEIMSVLLWASEQETEISERDLDLKFGLAADAADQVEEVARKSGQLYVALQQLTSKEAFDVLPCASGRRP